MPANPITSIPSNELLPKAVHKSADAWRNADTRVKDLQRSRREAEGAIHAAKLKDAEAFKDAVLANKPLPAEDAHQRAALDQLATIDKALEIANDARYRLGVELTVALRADDVRSHLYDAVRERLQPAHDAYLVALADAERAVSTAHRALTEATGGLSVLAALDSDREVRLIPVAIGGVPDFARARAAAAGVSQAMTSLAERVIPSDVKRHVRLRSGREVHMPRELAAGYVTAGEVDAFLDGLPPEKPAARPASLPADFRPI